MRSDGDGNQPQPAAGAADLPGMSPRREAPAVAWIREACGAQRIIDALRSENAALRSEIDALQRQLDIGAGG